METVTTVELPLARHPDFPKFPDVCVGCSVEEPEYGIESRDRPRRRPGVLGRLLIPDWMAFGRAPREEVKEAPACAECADEHNAHVRVSRWLWIASTAVLIGAAFWIWSSADLSSGLSKRAVILIGIVLLPLAGHLARRIAPPLFEIYAGERTVQYRFLNHDYAQQFRAANAQRLTRGAASASRASRRR